MLMGRLSVKSRLPRPELPDDWSKMMDALFEMSLLLCVSAEGEDVLQLHSQKERIPDDG